MTSHSKLLRSAKTLQPISVIVLIGILISLGIYVVFHSHAASCTLSGDANCDGVVNILDLSILASNYGNSGMNWAQGDFNSDGLVNITDLSILASNWGKTAVAANPAATTAGFYPCDAIDKVSCLKTLAGLMNRTIQSLHVTLMTDSSSSSNMAGNGWGMFVGDGQAYPYQWQNVNPHVDLTISVPLAFGGFTPSQATGSAELTAVANGTYDSDYQQLVNYAMNAGYTNVIWRLGWEFDGNWMPWSSQNNPNEFVAAYKHVHDIVKAAMPNAKFDWCGTAGNSTYTTQWSSAYPGDSYVDYIGMDTYNIPNYTSLAQFQTNITPDLLFQENFANTHGKQLSYPEWGLGSMDEPYFIQAMHDWFDALPATGAGSLGYNDYFDANTGGATAIESNPNSKALFFSLFSK
ncbi:MAG: glycosyl hydrolase [Candidatus Saccharimonadia bacterium]